MNPMAPEEAGRQLLLKALDRKERLRKVTLWVILLLLALPIVATIWLLIAGSHDAKPTSEASLAAIRNEIGRVNQASTEQTQAREAERAQFMAVQDQVQQSLSTGQNRVARLENQTVAQAQIVTSARSALEGIEKHNVEMDAKLAEVASRSDRTSDELHAQIANLITSLQKVESTNVSLANDSATIRASLSTLQVSQNDLTGRLQSFETSVANMNANLLALDRRVSKLEAEVAEMREPSWFRRMIDRISGKSRTPPQAP